MDSMKEQAIFLKELYRLLQMNRETLGDGVGELYIEDLSIYPLETVMDALTWARKNLPRFPKIAELLRYIEGDPQTHAENAWSTLVVTAREYKSFCPRTSPFHAHIQ